MAQKTNSRPKGTRSYANHLKVDDIFNSLDKNKFPQWHRFTSVNIWRSTFGKYAVMAIYDLYSQKFNIPFKDARKKGFTECVDALRKLEYPDYIPHKD